VNFSLLFIGLVNHWFKFGLKKVMSFLVTMISFGVGQYHICLYF
jgi:hypothetical protein